MRELSPYYLQHASSPSREESAVFNEPVIIPEEGIDLRDYWRMLRKHLWLIVMCFLGTLLVTALIVLTRTPLYTAESTLLIERKGPQVLNIEQALTESLLPDEYDYYKTQYEILESRSLVAQVIKQQGLENNGLFTGKEKMGLVERLWTRAQEWVEQRIEQWFSSPSQDLEGLYFLGVKPKLIDRYIDKMLRVQPVVRTRLVKVAFTTPDPALSAQVANAHVAAYIRQGLGQRTSANQEAERFLEEKLVELKERVEKSEAALNRYRRDQGIISLDDKENIVVDRLSDLNKRLTEAEAERIGLEAQSQLIRSREYDSLPDVIKNPLIQDLKGDLTRLEGEYAQLSAQFKPGYPRMVQLQAQVAETRSRLQREISRVVGGIESAYLAGVAKERDLRSKMDEQKTATLGLKDASVQYAILAREVDTNRQLYDSVLGRMKEVGMASELRTSNVSVIDQAQPPPKPSRPRKQLSFFLSAFLGLMGGVGLAFFFEYWDNTLKTPEEVERYLHLPNLTVVPDFLKLNGHTYGYAPKAVHHTVNNKKSGVKGQKPALQPGFGASKELVIAHHPMSMLSEAYRTLRTSILLSRAGEPPRIILFTSGTHGEGKTSTTLNTAVVFAQMGVKVLVIDADLRRPRCHKALGVERGLGLTELLTGQREAPEVIIPTGVENVSFLSSGSSPPNPAELLGSKKMRESLAFLREQYDYILIDSPPVIPVSDAVLLSTMVEGVVFVVGGQQTPKHVVREAQARLGYARAKVLGVVLNRVDVQNGDYAYYYHHYYSYYHHTETGGRD